MTTSYMSRALELARMALGNTSPNPAVGAVIVKDGQVVGEGRTQPRGSWHAEIVALRAAGEKARHADLYVTLEPCCHYGRTPPCTRAIIDAGIARVHIATLDPNPLVDSQGVAELREAGIDVDVGEGEEEARELYESFFHHVTKGLPFVTAKFAATLDGKIATHTGNSQWITGEDARQRVHMLRRWSDAIMVGIGTVLADDPQLTARWPVGDAADAGRQPLRIVVDSKGRTPPTARLLHEPGATIIATTAAADERKLSVLQREGAEILILPEVEGTVYLPALMRVLGRREITSVLVEGGGTLLGSFFDARLVDKLIAFIAPVIIGGRNAPSPVGGKGVGLVSQASRLHRVRVERLGEDLMVTGYLEK